MGGRPVEAILISVIGGGILYSPGFNLSLSMGV